MSNLSALTFALPEPALNPVSPGQPHIPCLSGEIPLFCQEINLTLS